MIIKTQTIPLRKTRPEDACVCKRLHTHTVRSSQRAQRRLFRQGFFFFVENVQILTNYVRISERFIAGWRSESEVLEVWLAEARASERATCSSSPEGSRMGLGFSKASVPVIHLDIVPSHITTFQKNMIQCKMFLFCFLHCDSSNIGKTHAWETKISRNYLLLRIVWLVRPFLTFF